jgi:hypothetical protein
MVAGNIWTAARRRICNGSLRKSSERLRNNGERMSDKLQEGLIKFFSVRSVGMILARRFKAGEGP